MRMLAHGLFTLGTREGDAVTALSSYLVLSAHSARPSLIGTISLETFADKRFPCGRPGDDDDGTELKASSGVFITCESCTSLAALDARKEIEDQYLRPDMGQVKLSENDRCLPGALGALLRG